MRILLAEHATSQLFHCETKENFINKSYFDSYKIEERRMLFSKVFPYSISHNQTKECYDIQADYYVGLDWLVKGVKYVQVEPKINKKLLAIYEASLEKEFETEEEAEQNDDINKDEIEQSVKNENDVAQVNYLKMLLDIYASGISEKEIGHLVEIYWEETKIRIEQKDDYLTPFLVVQFLGLLKTIARKGLKKSYYKVQENLNNRIKGKILVGQHIKQNVFKNRFTSTFCEYQVFGENNPENQFLKKVFQFCTSYVENHSLFFKDTKIEIENIINYIRPTFQHISDYGREQQLKHFKHNPFFKEYKEAIQIGNLILKQFAYNISSTTKTEIETPPFWIDMPRLFELYFYQKLLKANQSAQKDIKYQFATHGNSLDFLIKNGKDSIIIDTKYKLQYQHGQIHEDIRQVSGYARLKKVRKECDLTDYDDTHLKCLIIYPSLENTDINFTLENIQNQLNEDKEIKAYHKVYKLGINLPVL